MVEYFTDIPANDRSTTSFNREGGKRKRSGGKNAKKIGYD